MLETVLTNLVVLAAALFLARWFYRNLVSRDKAAACDSCESCESTEVEDGAEVTVHRT